MVNYSILLPTGRLLDVVDEQVGFALGTECAQNEGVACSKGQRSRGRFGVNSHKNLQLGEYFTTTSDLRQFGLLSTEIWVEGVWDFMLALHNSWIGFHRVLGLQGSGPLKLHALLQYQNYSAVLNQEEGRVWSCNEGTLNNARRATISNFLWLDGKAHPTSLWRRSLKGASPRGGWARTPRTWFKNPLIASHRRE